jgi:hypothetical protein
MALAMFPEPMTLMLLMVVLPIRDLSLVSFVLDQAPRRLIKYTDLRA